MLRNVAMPTTIDPKFILEESSLRTTLLAGSMLVGETGIIHHWSFLEWWTSLTVRPASWGSFLRRTIETTPPSNFGICSSIVAEDPQVLGCVQEMLELLWNRFVPCNSSPDSTLLEFFLRKVIREADFSCSTLAMVLVNVPLPQFLSSWNMRALWGPRSLAELPLCPTTCSLVLPPSKRAKRCGKPTMRSRSSSNKNHVFPTVNPPPKPARWFKHSACAVTLGSSPGFWWRNVIQ